MALTQVYHALKHIEATKSRNDKEDLVNHYLKEIGRPFYLTMKYALEPSMKYHCKSIEYKDIENDIPFRADRIFEKLKQFSEQSGVMNEEKKQLAYLCNNDETAYVVNRILEGNLRVGVSKEIAKKYIPDFTDPAVMLCYYRLEYLRRYDILEGQLNAFVNKCKGWNNIIAQVKKDGTRIKYVKEQYFSRSGLNTPFYEFLQNDINDFQKALRQVLGYTNDYQFELDGEMMYHGELDSTATDYSRIKDIDIDKITFDVFDIPNLKLPQKERLEAIDSVLLIYEGNKIKACNWRMVESEEDLMAYFRHVLAEGEEGLILKDANCEYEPKKSGCWSKLKEWENEDLIVVGVKEGTGKTKGMVGTFICEFNGQQVDVGKGRAKEHELIEWLKNPPSVIEVKYAEITPDGKLKFPTFYKDRTGDK